MGAVFKTVSEYARACLGGFDPHTPPPIRFWILGFGFWIAINLNLEPLIGVKYLSPPSGVQSSHLTEEEFKHRTKQVALRIIRLVHSLPKSLLADVLGKQLLRSGTSIGANYRAACRGKSRRDVVHKLSIVEEEADESLYWIELLIDAELIRSARVSSLNSEINQILAMTVSSIKTMRRKSVNPKSKT